MHRTTLLNPLRGAASMFIRTKKIQKYRYAYLVESRWTKQGTRQKTKAYLGRVFDFGDVSHELPDVENVTTYFEGALRDLLQNAGFTQNGARTERDGIVVHVKRCSVRKAGKPCVIAINEGFVCDHTLKDLFKFQERKYISRLQSAQENVGHILAKSLIGCGLVLDGESFIELYGKLVPNSI